MILGTHFPSRSYDTSGFHGQYTVTIINFIRKSNTLITSLIKSSAIAKENKQLQHHLHKWKPDCTANTAQGIEIQHYCMKRLEVLEVLCIVSNAYYRSAYGTM